MSIFEIEPSLTLNLPIKLLSVKLYSIGCWVSVIACYLAIFSFTWFRQKLWFWNNPLNYSTLPGADKNILVPIDDPKPYSMDPPSVSYNKPLMVKSRDAITRLNLLRFLITFQ
jgi:hypothetical protein